MNQEDFENIRGEFYMFWNCSKAVGKPCLVGLLTGNAAVAATNEPDDIIVEKARAAASRLASKAYRGSVKIVESVVTRWQIDQFSRGSYSYVGLEATGADFDVLARPIGHSLFFAGEATCRTHPGTVHGAYISGLRAASETLTSLIGEIEIPYPLIPSKDGSGSRSHYATAASSQVGSSMVTPIPPISKNLSPLGPQYGIRSGGDHNHHSSSLRSSTVPDLPHSDVPHDEYYDDSSDSGAPSKHVDHSKLDLVESALMKLREERISHDNERMRHDLVMELGERPVKPERLGANPFLIFQKDFWEKCRQETDLAKQKASGDANAKAARNEVRAALGKMWREFPEEKKIPYLEATKNIKDENNKKSDEFRKKLRQYDSEAEDFRRRWKEENATEPSSEERRLERILDDANYHNRTKKRKR
ncbi:hypothetical protein AWJ20_574 [Sugiyamaella lignohabitans]|uniref:HMG box domain-containing protein n=1 Tax=Sugiyamaella lignohabitans TaxID=796027 RepID=A0A167D0D8_9ASCO|nr:uncharacterized protein AWJ20_574 [Sugiyamaella lignohabitans]ANB12324.1 hypothetical protein AWJ20_574 [Sugiyamaella lignohabitans]